jgi:long-subunit fatty acid transport protein
MNFKKQLFIITLLISSVSVFSQQHDSNSFSWDQMRYGGRFSFEFSNNVTSITVAPSAVYQFNEQFAAGGTISFGYTDFRNIDSYLFNYGASILGIYTPIQQIQLSVELEQVFVNQKYDDFFPNNNYNYQALFLGAGYRMRNVVIGLRYDVLYNEDRNLYASPYAPFVQVFF